ncbi:MAG TPA: hypothetical protein VK537_07565 [Galbitalea sp.]|nr:hypothetical protein [Galbitalea sp.]
MIDAHRLAHDYFSRIALKPASRLDATYQWQLTQVIETSTRLAAILDDEGIPDETAARIIRSVLYGAPSVVEAEQRMKHMDLLRKMFETPPEFSPERLRADLEAFKES